MIIGLDFDGTVVTHEFPRVGKDIGAVQVLKRLVDAGHKLILNTMRDDDDARGHHYLKDAVDWFTQRDIPLYGINENPTQKEWTNSPKVYAHIYIDDMALGTPLRIDKSMSASPFVDWDVVEQYLAQIGLFNAESQINKDITNDSIV